MTLLGFLAVAALVLSAVSLLVIGGVVFALLLFFPLFLLALVGVLAGVDDRTVRRRNPSMSPRGWRDGR